MFIWPVDGPVSRGFGYKSSIYVGGMHAAIDIPASIGTPYRAVAAGIIASVGWDFYSGHFVAVDHYGEWRSLYRHGSDNSPVTTGQSVNQGQIVGYSGNTGYTLGPHLHFDLWNREKKDPTAFYKNGWWAHDPELYLGQEDDMKLDNEDKAWFQKQLDNQRRGILSYLEKAHLVTRRQAKDAIGALPNADGATSDEIKKAVKQAHREGTG